MNPVETYFRELRELRASGESVPETTYYSTLWNLLNEIGKSLKPKVRCLPTPRNRGAGIPDAGLYTSEQFRRGLAPIEGQTPSRGVIEVKPVRDDAGVTADSEQVLRYWQRYRLVLVTNYRDFVPIGPDSNGRPTKLESYQIAASEVEFWDAVQDPHKLAEDHAERFTEYLKRVMLQAAPLASPQDVAWFLASYARDARIGIAHAKLPALASVRTALEEALGLKFEGEKGDLFFRSTLVQTLFYGIFSAWVLWSKENPPNEASAPRFDWRQAMWYLKVPMISALFEQVATRSRIEELGLIEVLDWTEAVLNRVVRGEFQARFEEEHAIQYFYEPFLEAFDPALRKSLGIWYTPLEIVRYMVARVDTVLRDELGLADGLADPRVYVLDPCCGTGAYLVEVLKCIAATLRQKGDDGLLSNDIKLAAMNRVFGFEILPAPFVISHLQLGLLLGNLGAPLSDDRTERAGVFLTNSLTGWELRDQPSLVWPEMEAERKGSDEVKRDKPILVVLGNPPYNAFAGISPQEEEGLVELYKGAYSVAPPRNVKTTRLPRRSKNITKMLKRYRLSDPESRGGWGIKKFNLDDLYVRFFRLAERRIADKTGEGLVCYISNFSYLSDPSFVIMRERFLSEFDAVWFDCLNGDSRETGKLTPEGKPDPSIFSTKYNPEGIRVGTAIGLMLRRHKRDEQRVVRFREFWGTNKRSDLLNSLDARDFNSEYETTYPERSNWFSFRASEIAVHYLSWPNLLDLCGEPPTNGLMEKRKGGLIDIDKDALSQRMRLYYDPDVDWARIEALNTGLTKLAAEYEPKGVRAKVQAIERFDPTRLKRYAVRPLETRWCYYSEVGSLWNRSRPVLWAQCWQGNSFLLTRFRRAKDPEGSPCYFTTCLSDDHLLAPDAVAIPMRVRPVATKRKKNDPKQTDLFVARVSTANLSLFARQYLASIGITNPDDADASPLLWWHALCIGYSPAYLRENDDGIAQDWPRIPLPDTQEALFASAELGASVAGLLDTESAVAGVTTGTIRTELRAIGNVLRVGGGALNEGPDLALTVGWGHPGKGGVTMPGKGRIVERPFSPAELDAIHSGAESLGISADYVIKQLGEHTLDVYLNEVAYWKNIPFRIWGYTIGGYQVIKKWLSYREKDMLHRSLSSEEAREVMNMARRIAAILLLEPALDENYQRVKGATFPWST
jgi:hypothetical protein